MTVSRNMARMLVLPFALALAGTGCMAQGPDDEPTSDDPAVAAPESESEVAGAADQTTKDDATGKAQQACGFGGGFGWGGFGDACGCLGYGPWGSLARWGGWGGYFPGWGIGSWSGAVPGFGWPFGLPSPGIGPFGFLSGIGLGALGGCGCGC